MPLSPHDDLFKATFAIQSQAKAFLQQFMPSDVLDGLDFSTLERDPDSYVDEQLKSHFTDMVYSCQWKGSVGASG
jgi:predicted transposase YdaD